MVCDSDSPSLATGPTILSSVSAVSVSVVAPFFNERECARRFIEEVTDRLTPLALEYEIICVDDASSDGTPQLLRELGEHFPRVRPFALDAHHGQSAALWAGIGQAQGAIVVLLDSDLQNDPADVAAMIRRLEGDPTLAAVVGVRSTRRDTWLRRISSRIANRVAERITGHRVRDAGCGLKVIRTRYLRSIPFFRGAHRFIATLVAMEGGRVLEVEVNHRPRPSGISKYGRGLGRTFTALRDALGVRWLMDRKLRQSVRPIRGEDWPVVPESSTGRSPGAIVGSSR